MRCEAFAMNKKQASKKLSFVFVSESGDVILFATVTFLFTNIGVTAPMFWASTSY